MNWLAFVNSRHQHNALALVVTLTTPSSVAVALKAWLCASQCLTAQFKPTWPKGLTIDQTMWTDWTYWLTLGRCYCFRVKSIAHILEQTTEVLITVHSHVEQCLTKKDTDKYQKLNYKVEMAAIKSTKTRVVVMVTNTRRHPYINLWSQTVTIKK